MGEILNLPGHDIIKQTINCKISPLGILFRGPNHHLGNPGIFLIDFSSQIDQIDPQVINFNPCSLQMFGLILVYFGHPETTGFRVLFQVNLGNVQKMFTCHIVQGNVYVVGMFA